MNRRLLAALYAALTLPALADTCPPAPTYPLTGAELTDAYWIIHDGQQLQQPPRHYIQWRLDGAALQLPAGWQVLRYLPAALPVVDRRLMVVGYPVDTVHLPTETVPGCVTSEYQIGWLGEPEIRANIESLATSARQACAATVEYGSISGRTDYLELCATAAGVGARRDRGESITDPGEADSEGWCAAYTRDCASPNGANARALIDAALGARADALGSVADPRLMPNLDLGWTDTPTLAAPEGE